jgi:hypothetical protein
MEKKASKFILQALVFASLFATATMWAPSASAQDGGPPSETTYDFEDDLVTGDLVRPDGEQLIVRRRGRRASLIQIREHFIPEMLKSVEDL